MRKCKIDKALDELNAKRGLVYPQVGFLYFADVRGDGDKVNRRVWQIVNASGGITYSDLNARLSKLTLAKIRERINEA